MSIVAPVNEIGRCDIFLYFNLYAGEQYNAETGLYYNRARYMDPTTGTFISMDSYSGSIYDPVSLHKYLYANANPVTYTDPTGYFSFSELMVVQKIQGIINTVQMSSGLFKVLRWVNAIVTVYDVFQQIKGLVEEGKSVEEIVAVMLKDGAIDLLLDGLCSTKIGFILKPVLFVFSLGVQTNQLVWAWTEGTTMDKIMYTAQAIAMVFGLAQQCFTGDTLVWTENGTIAISEVAIGDEVYAYDAETGEAILAKVTDISVSETNELVHLTIDGELIRTTASHPFYTASGEWKAAGDLMVGDHVVTMTGEATVEATEVKRLSEAVTVYNLTVEGEHNYYVAENGVLVHNVCDGVDSANNNGDFSGTGEYKDVGGHHVHAKAGFNGDVNYDPKKGFSISQDFMESNGLNHQNMTSKQRELFKELYESGRPNTLDEHTRIAREALKAGGASDSMIDALINASLNNLAGQGVTSPTRIPWYSK